MKRIAFNDNWTCTGSDGTKRAVTLPHDAMISEPRSVDNPSGSAGAFFPGGLYTYQKTFHAPKEWAGGQVLLQFEGVYKNARIYINGKDAGGAAYGYIPFFVAASGLLDYGADNIITVVADNMDQPNSRWYTGSGIYRPVWLWLGEKACIYPEGVRITTLAHAPAKIRVQTTHTGGEVAVEIQWNGATVVTAAGDDVELDIPNARLWSADAPNLYTCRVSLRQNGKMTDEVCEQFGIRTIAWGPQGLFVNGNDVLLRGGCVHHDNGILGARSYPESEARRVHMLKKAGFNAIRSSHYPASPAMIQACDECGMYLIDETWDMWYSHKSAHDYAGDFTANYRADVEALVRRDYNHPSVLMYSIGNEVSEPAEQRGVELTRELVTMFHTLDATRPVTGGINLMIIARSAAGNAVYQEGGGLNEEEGKQKIAAMDSTAFNAMVQQIGTSINNAANNEGADRVTAPCLDALDIAGYNYASGRYPLEGELHPDRVLFGAETYPQDIAKNWAMVKQYPYLVGDFMWTAWDYLGETGIGAWSYTEDGPGFGKPYPWLLADTGALDILGNPTGEIYLAQAAWGLLDRPVIAVQPVNHPGVPPKRAIWRGTNAIPSWAWCGCEGNEAVVEVYTDAHEVELLLNGESLGRAPVTDFVASFFVAYAPGTLEAVTYDTGGKETGRSALSSAGQVGIRVLPERATAAAGEVMYLVVVLADENGVIESNADTLLSVSVVGGELLAFGSANPRTEEGYHTGSHTTYYGWAQAVVRAGAGGSIRVTVQGEGLASGSAEIVIQQP